MSAKAKGQGFTMLDDEFMRSHPHLSIDSRWLYLRLRRYGSRIPTLKSIAEDHGVDYHVLYRAVKQLLAHDMIVKVAHGKYQLSDSATSVCDNAKPSCESATPTTETPRHLETKPVAPCATVTTGEEMILGSYGDSPDPAPDLPRPRKRGARPVEQWNQRALAKYMESERLSMPGFYGHPLNEARVSGFIRSRLTRGVTPVEVKGVIDAFLGNPTHAQSATDLSGLFLQEFDLLLARIRNAGVKTTADLSEYLE